MTSRLKPGFDFVDDKGKRFGLYLWAGERTFIELFAGRVEGQAGEQSYRHLCLEVEDLQAAVTHIRGKGVDVIDAKLGMDNSWQAWISDPDGNAIELHQYTLESKQVRSFP